MKINTDLYTKTLIPADCSYEQTDRRTDRQIWLLEL